MRKSLTKRLVFSGTSCYNKRDFSRRRRGKEFLRVIGYLRNLFEALDFTSMGATALRVAAVFLCLTIHETCHGLAALALGDPTARNLHRLSLNPLRHIDWLGLVMMFVAGFGWAKPVPVDPRYFRNPKWGMALTALAGPGSNFLLAAASLFLARILTATTSNALAIAFFGYSLPLLSLGLGVFNLIPFPPLDGSKVLAAFLPDGLYIRWMRYESFGTLILFVIFASNLDGDFISRAVYWLYAHMLILMF